MSSNPIAAAIFSPDYSGLCRFWGLTKNLSVWQVLQSSLRLLPPLASSQQHQNALCYAEVSTENSRYPVQICCLLCDQLHDWSQHPTHRGQAKLYAAGRIGL